MVTKADLDQYPFFWLYLLNHLTCTAQLNAVRFFLRLVVRFRASLHERREALNKLARIVFLPNLHRWGRT